MDAQEPIVLRTFEDYLRAFGGFKIDDPTTHTPGVSALTGVPQSLVQSFNGPGYDIDPDDCPDATSAELAALADPNRLFIRRVRP